jgi:hypothetical protein
MKTQIRTVLVVLLLVGSAVGPMGIVSANSPEYNGSVTLNGNAASDGSTFSYELESTDGVDDFSVDLIGTINEQQRALSGSSTETVDIDGTLDPVDSSISVGHVEGSVGYSGTGTGERPYYGETTKNVTLDGAETLQSLTISGHMSDANEVTTDYVNYDVYIDGEYVDSHSHKGGKPYMGTRSQTTTGINKSIDGDMEIDLVPTSSGHSWTWDDWSAQAGVPPESVSVSVNGGPSTTLNDGESTDADLDLGSNDIAVDVTGNGSANWQIDTTERTGTRDPSVTINGETVSYSGTLGDGTTQSLTVDESWIKNGTNNVSVSTNDPSSGPGSLVDIDYSHDTNGTVHTTTLNSTTWEEFYNVSNTYGSDVSDTVVTLPFSENVIDIDTVRMRTNGGSWQYPNSWGLSNAKLGVNIGDVNAGDTVDVRARGRKVNVENGQIEVTKPTVEGDRLETEFKIENAESDFGIDVGRTSSGSNLHYLESSSWSSDETTKFDGSQTLQLPNAPTGGTATVTTAPIKVDPLAGDVYVEWASDATNTEPRFHVKPGDREGDTVSYAFTSGVTGTEYSLYSESEGIVRDSGTANSPVWFEDDDSQETFQILTESSSSVSTGGGGGGFFESPSSAVQGAAQQAAGIMPVVDPIWVVVLVVGLIGGAVAYTERRSPTGSTPIYRRPAVGLAVVVAGGLTVFLISPTTITGPLQTTLGAILPLAGILVLFGGAALVWSRRQNNNGGSGGSQSTTEQMVALVPLRRSNDEQTGDGATDDGWFK